MNYDDHYLILFSLDLGGDLNLEGDGGGGVYLSFKCVIQWCPIEAFNYNQNFG